MPAKHLFISKTQGPEQGMESFLSSTKQIKLPQVVAKRKAILSKRTPETRLAAYCSVFKIKGAQIRKATEVVESAVVNEEPVEASNFITALDGRRFLLVDGKAVEVTNITEDHASFEPVEPVGVVITDVITKGEAWEALGADEKFAPNDPSLAAGGRYLHRLNELGLLRIVGA